MIANGRYPNIRKLILGTLAATSMLFAFPSAVFADIVQPVDEQVIADTSTSFTIEGDSGTGNWIIFAPSDEWICADALVNGVYGSNSMNGWKTACGTSATLAEGAYHILWVDNGTCRNNDGYEACEASGDWLGTTNCLDVGDNDYCAAEEPPPGGSTSTTSTGDTANTDLFHVIVIVYISAFFVVYIGKN